MRCPKCGQEFSESVYRVHVQRCNVVVEKDAILDLNGMKKSELVDLANENGIDTKYMNKADIIAALEK